MNRRAVRALTGAIVVVGAVSGVAVAGAAQQAADQTITADGTNVFQPANISIETGDTVTWNFTGGAHNAQSENEVPADPNWANFATPVPSTGTHPYTFTQPGTYQYVCLVHTAQNMRGTITVTGEPTEPPDPPDPPTPPAPQPPAATPTPGPSGSTPSTPGGTTPAPGSAARDGAAPVISGVSVKAIRRGARVTLTLTETSTVTLRFKQRKSRKVVRTARLQVRAGKRTLTVRGSRLKRGRYLVELEARDSGGNAAAMQRASLRIKKARG